MDGIQVNTTETMIVRINSFFFLGASSGSAACQAYPAFSEKKLPAAPIRAVNPPTAAVIKAFVPEKNFKLLMSLANTGDA